MPFIDQKDEPFIDAVSRLVYCNPFLPERIEHERAALGPAFAQGPRPWNVHPDELQRDANIANLTERATSLVEAMRERMHQGVRPGDAGRRRYEDLALFVLYHRFLPRFESAMGTSSAKSPAGAAEEQRSFTFYRQFAAEARRLFDAPGAALPTEDDLPHLFARFFQIRRAFDYIYSCIIGLSRPAVRLRAEVWQSIFTHDMRRYRDRLYDRMGDLTTLITGPSGTGKELVATAIGCSRYIAFDATRRRFAVGTDGAYQALNLSALSPTLIESELFGHRRGSFTGAVADHVGWLERCPPEGTVFLDEIGDLDSAIQVKLLRVLQSREFQSIGDTKTRVFRGKIITATNRDLAREMAAGRFRNDLYYRLCSDLICTPSLRERLEDEGEELNDLVLHLVERILGDADASLVEEVLGWIDRHLGRDYAWPGNIRELEQCVRNVLVRGVYRPPAVETGAGERARLLGRIDAGDLTADELLRCYCTLVYAQCGNYVETARRLDIDRRTVRARVDPELLDEL